MRGKLFEKKWAICAKCAKPLIYQRLFPSTLFPIVS